MMPKFTLVVATSAIAFISGVGLSFGLTPSRDSIFEKDSVVAAAANNQVLYENDHIRLIEVTIRPGETEPFHTHPYPTISIFDAVQPSSSYEGLDGRKTILGRNFTKFGTTLSLQLTKQTKTGWADKLPVVEVEPANPNPHKCTNIDIFTYHYYRLEFKRIDGNDSVDAATKSKKTLEN